MTKSALKRTSLESPPRDDQFYETMPMYAQPHSIYRDDEADNEYELEANKIERDRSAESMQLSTRLTALVALAVVVLLALALIVLAVYGLGIISDSAAPSASLTSGSLEM